MNIDQYKKSLKHPLRPRTVSFLVKGDDVLLGLKKKGFGKGYYLGIGGKVEGNESIEQAAIREIEEEVAVKVADLKKVAVLNFYFPHVSDESWNQQVHAFLVNKWNGELQESEEIKPEWFNKNKIPLDKMWDDARYWLPQVLKGEQVQGNYIFNESLKVIKFTQK